MKRFVWILTILLGAGQLLSAQEAPDGRHSGIFVGAGTGMNFGFDGLKFDDRPTSHNGAGFASDFYLGGWLGRGFGVRAGYQGFGISDRYTDFGNRNYTYVHGDLLMRPHKNVIPYVHGGYVRIVNSGMGGGVGLMTPVHLGNHVSIVPDIKATAYSSHVFDTKDRNVALTLSATIGLSIRFGGRKREPKVTVPPVDTDIRFIHDTVRVKEVVTNVVRDTVYIEHHDTTVLHPEKISALALFDTDKSVLRPEVFPDLNKIVAWFEKYPEAKAVIEGHTDSTASAQYNQSLSERRAQAVYIYLIEHGVSADRLTWVGYGLTRPVDTNATPEGRQRNRRVEIHVE